MCSRADLKIGDTEVGTEDLLVGLIVGEGVAVDEGLAEVAEGLLVDQVLDQDVGEVLEEADEVFSP